MLMYSGFEIKINESVFNKDYFTELVVDGKERYTSVKKEIKEIIDSFTLDSGKIDGGKSSVSCPLKPSDSTPLKHSTMPP